MDQSWFLRAFKVKYGTLVNQGQSYADIHARFFEDKPRPPVYGKCVSSRHFEAIGTKTCQIMFRGQFNDILQPDQHYLPLNDDFSNLQEILVRFSDPTQRRVIVEQAYAHVMDAHTYAHRMRLLYDILMNQRAGVLFFSSVGLTDVCDISGDHQTELQTLHGASQNDPTPRLPLVSLAKLGFDCLNNEVLLVLL